MITVFNRKELLITHDMNEQSRVQSALSNAGIEYHVKVSNREGSSLAENTRGRLGSAGLNSGMCYEYKIYVKRDSYDAAIQAIRRK